MDLLKTILISVSLMMLVFYGCTQKGEIVGNDSDSHGCRASAGYSWCEEKQKCLRSWEEKCESPVILGNDTDEHGCKASAGYTWCEPLQKCIRPWETNCRSETVNASLEEQALQFCGQENVANVYVCGPYIRVVSSLLGGGSTFYQNGQVIAQCPVVGPDSMSDICKQLLLGNNCVEEEVNCTIPMPGSDQDDHGCIGSAGYTFCEQKSKCVRQWEEPCEGILTLDEARVIARNSSSCMIQSDIDDEYSYNNITKTWWLGMMAYKPGCDPACVVDEVKRTATLNWRCTGGMPTYTVKTMDAVGGLILTDGRGRSLYVFSEDSVNTSTCSGQCSQSFPPFVAPSTIVAPDSISGSLGILQRADSNIQVTYMGMPLYYYAADVAFGDVKGDGANNGKWSLARP